MTSSSPGVYDGVGVISVDDQLVPGASDIDERAADMLREDDELLQIVRDAVRHMSRAFRRAAILVHYTVEAGDDGKPEPLVYVSAQTEDDDAAERLRRVREDMIAAAS